MHHNAAQQNVNLMPAVCVQAVESLQELSNVSLDQVFSSSSLRRGPFSIRIPKNVLSSSASQTLSPRTPTQAHSSDSKQCVNCQCTSTPLWRKDKSSGLMYCNACGIYFKNHGKHRPLELIEGPPQIKLQQPGNCFQCHLGSLGYLLRVYARATMLLSSSPFAFTPIPMCSSGDVKLLHMRADLVA